MSTLSCASFLEASLSSSSDVCRILEPNSSSKSKKKQKERQKENSVSKPESALTQDVVDSPLPCVQKQKTSLETSFLLPFPTTSFPHSLPSLSPLSPPPPPLVSQVKTAEPGENNNDNKLRKFFHPKAINISLQTLSVALFFGGIAALFQSLCSALPPDFWRRWKKLFNEQSPNDPSVPVENRPPTTLYDCHGVVIATIGPGGFSSQKEPNKPGTPLRPTDIPAYMWQAVIASEDRRFFDHQGFDPKGISRAVFSLARTGGGSTITQQLVKNVFLTNERKWARKLAEILLAIWLEKRMSKWDILHLYLNKIYWGHGVHGIEAASALYFGKHPSNLTLSECAMLAGIIPAPELLSPYRDPSRGRKPQARSLRRMVEAGFLDMRTAKAAMQEPLVFGAEGKAGNLGPWRAPYFVSEVLYELSQKYGREEVLRGGYQVYTTLDLTMQDAAEKAVRESAREYDRERISIAQKGIESASTKRREVERDQRESIAAALQAAALKRSVELGKLIGNVDVSVEALYPSVVEAAAMVAYQEDSKLIATVAQKFSKQAKHWEEAEKSYQKELQQSKHARLEGAIVAMDPLTGEVRSLVGGRDYYESNFNRATQALRPPGSTFKPVVYLAALAAGIDKDYVLLDEPYQVDEFIPENYDRKFRGQVTLEESLVRSLNVPTVRLCAEVGVDNVCRMARALGIKTALPHELALSLGGCEMTPLQLATVYSTIASGGVYHPPRIITKVVTYDGTELDDFEPEVERRATLVDEYAVSELRKLLQLVVERGTGRAARLGRPCAGKTGTSDGHRDVWFAGFTPQMSAVVWFGYDDNEPVGGMHPGTGASHAAPVWKEFMGSVHEGLPVLKFHDMGTDKYGSRAAGREFEKRSRRPQKSFLRGHDRQKDSNKGERRQEWRDIWDWEKASSSHEEREKMEAWIAARKKKYEENRALKALWGKTVQKQSGDSSKGDVPPKDDELWENMDDIVWGGKLPGEEGGVKGVAFDLNASEAAVTAKWGPVKEGNRLVSVLSWPLGIFNLQGNSGSKDEGGEEKDSNSALNAGLHPLELEAKDYCQENGMPRPAPGDVKEDFCELARLMDEEQSSEEKTREAQMLSEQSLTGTTTDNSENFSIGEANSIGQQSNGERDDSSTTLASGFVGETSRSEGRWDDGETIEGEGDVVSLFTRGKVLPSEVLPYGVEKPEGLRVARRRAGSGWAEKEFKELSARQGAQALRKTVGSDEKTSKLTQGVEEGTGNGEMEVRETATGQEGSSQETSVSINEQKEVTTVVFGEDKVAVTTNVEEEIEIVAAEGVLSEKVVGRTSALEAVNGIQSTWERLLDKFNGPNVALPSESQRPLGHSKTTSPSGTRKVRRKKTKVVIGEVENGKDESEKMESGKAGGKSQGTAGSGRKKVRRKKEVVGVLLSETSAGDMEKNGRTKLKNGEGEGILYSFESTQVIQEESGEGRGASDSQTLFAEKLNSGSMTDFGGRPLSETEGNGMVSGSNRVMDSENGNIGNMGSWSSLNSLREEPAMTKRGTPVGGRPVGGGLQRRKQGEKVEKRSAGKTQSSVEAFDTPS